MFLFLPQNRKIIGRSKKIELKFDQKGLRKV